LEHWHQANHRLRTVLHCALNAQTLTVARAFIHAKLIVEETCVAAFERSCRIAQGGEAKHHALIA
jgi:hypothetical protein